MRLGAGGVLSIVVMGLGAGEEAAGHAVIIGSIPLVIHPMV
jgi:hypothetical protein